MKNNKVVPFLKWAGGKRQLIKKIDNFLPYDIKNNKINTYIEPFIGGGALFFNIIQKYNIKNYYIFDINEDLIRTYKTIKNDIDNLTIKLDHLEKNFYNKKEKQRKKLYYEIRNKFNKYRLPEYLIFLNKTCFNGLYRVNKKNEFNVPFGYYKRPKICDSNNLYKVSNLLQDVNIKCSDFENCKNYIDDKTFIYLDPPYLPINSTSNFTSYYKKDFGIEEQKRLSNFCKFLDNKGVKFLLSNSSSKNNFFENEYKDFNINKILARRSINSKGNKRGEIKENIITNYKNQ